MALTIPEFENSVMAEPTLTSPLKVERSETSNFSALIIPVPPKNVIAEPTFTSNGKVVAVTVDIDTPPILTSLGNVDIPVSLRIIVPSPIFNSPVTLASPVTSNWVVAPPTTVLARVDIPDTSNVVESTCPMLYLSVPVPTVPSYSLLTNSNHAPPWA